MISRENFLSLYKTLPPRTAEKIINPMDLIDLDHQNEWHFARFVMDENELQIYLQDASGQVLYDSHPAKDILSQGNEAASYETTLQQFPEFADRIIPANTFNEAYERLSRAYRIQVINNPYKLIQWGDDLKNVAISKYSENGVVVIACEVISHNLNSVYRFEASEIAVSHLIVIINHISDDIQISQPVARMK